MNIVNKLTIRHLIHNKKRTLVTIIGVMISVALITSIATFSSSLLDLMQRQSIADDGNWHVLYKDVNKAQLETIRQDEATKEMVISQDGYAVLTGSKNADRPYLYIKDYNNAGFTHFPIELTEGRLPEKANELVISEEVDFNAKVKFKIGDSLTLDIGERVSKTDSRVLTQHDSFRDINGKVHENLTHKVAKSYTIVGFIKRPAWETSGAAGYTAISCLDVNSIDMNKANASVVVKKINRNLISDAQHLAETNNINAVKFNNDLLRYYGVVDSSYVRTYYSLFAMVIIVILISSVSLIYNAFAMSVSERIRHLGMLSSIGATRKQKRNSVFFEGAIIGAISIPLGVLCGLIGIATIIWFLNGMIENFLRTSSILVATEKLTLTITPLSILIAVAISFMSIFFSTYLPAIKASRISAIDAIRQRTDIKLEEKTRNTSSFVRRFLGVEAEIALKNLRRNKHRFYTTLLSLIISIVLVLIVSFFTSNRANLYDIHPIDDGYDLYFVRLKQDDSLIKSIISFKEVTDYRLFEQSTCSMLIDSSTISNELLEYFQRIHEPLNNKGQYNISVKLDTLNDEKLEAYTKNVGVNYQKLKHSNDSNAILYSYFQFEQEPGKIVQANLSNVKAGQILSIEVKKNENKDFRIAAVADQTPIGGIGSPSGAGIHLIVSQEVLDRMKVKAVNQYFYVNSKEPLKTEQEIHQLDRDLYIFSNYEIRQKNKQSLLLIRGFGYGFIALVTVISMANIFNTISTSIALRKREFALLRSMGMESKRFKKMIRYEGIFYGVASLALGIPISIIMMCAMYYLSLPYSVKMLYDFQQKSYFHGFTLPWISILVVTAIVITSVSYAMHLTASKVQRDNIIDVLKQENL